MATPLLYQNIVVKDMRRLYLLRDVVLAKEGYCRPLEWWTRRLHIDDIFDQDGLDTDDTTLEGSRADDPSSLSTVTLVPRIGRHFLAISLL